MQKEQNKLQVTNKTLLSILICLTLALTVPLNGCIFQVKDSTTVRTSQVAQIPDDLSFDELAELLFTHEVVLDTMTLNQMVEDPEKLGITAPEPTFGDLTLEAYQSDDDYYREYLEKLDKFSPDNLSPEQQITQIQIKRVLELTLKTEEYFYYSEPARPSTGTPAALPLSLTEFFFRSAADIDTYLELLKDMPRYFGQLADFEREKQKRNLLMPLEAMQETLTDIQNFIVEPSEHILVSSFTSQLESDIKPFGSLTNEQKQEYKKRIIQVVRDSVIPAYQQLYDSLLEISKSCKSGTSIANYSKGRDYYQIEMQAYGFSQTPPEATKTLDDALNSYWDTILDSPVSYDQSQKARGAAVSRIANNPEAMLNYLQSRSTKDFPDIGKIPFKVKQAPPETPNDFALAFFIIPPVDNPNENTIYYFPENIANDADLFKTLAHEGIAGHMYQTNYFASQNPANIQKYLMNISFMEGWAMYAQNYSYNYLDIPDGSAAVLSAYDNFMYGLQARIDFGVNFDGWNVLAVQNYLKQWGMESAAQDLFDTAIKQPLAYLPYGLGVIEFNQLSQRAQTTLGTQYNPVSFHKQILVNGGLPFDLLEAKFEDWLSGVARVV